MTPVTNVLLTTQYVSSKDPLFEGTDTDTYLDRRREVSSLELPGDPHPDHIEIYPL